MSILTLQRFLAVNKKSIIWMFRAAYAVVIFLYMAGFYWYDANPDLFFALSARGASFGQIALILYLITLLPGILKRFGVLPPLRTMLMLFRRQFGVLMFLTGGMHSAYTTTVYLIKDPNFTPDMLQNFHQMGVLAWWVLFPLWVTSNDLAVKKLGKFWDWVHRLTYLALLLIFLHVALMGSTGWAVLTGSVIALELGSWLKVWFFTPKRVKTVSAQSTVIEQLPDES